MPGGGVALAFAEIGERFRRSVLGASASWEAKVLPGLARSYAPDVAAQIVGDNFAGARLLAQVQPVIDAIETPWRGVAEGLRQQLPTGNLETAKRIRGMWPSFTIPHERSWASLVVPAGVGAGQFTLPALQNSARLVAGLDASLFDAFAPIRATLTAMTEQLSRQLVPLYGHDTQKVVDQLKVNVARWARQHAAAAQTGDAAVEAARAGAGAVIEFVGGRSLAEQNAGSGGRIALGLMAMIMIAWGMGVGGGLIKELYPSLMPYLELVGDTVGVAGWLGAPTPQLPPHMQPFRRRTARLGRYNINWSDNGIVLRAELDGPTVPGQSVRMTITGGDGRCIFDGEWIVGGDGWESCRALKLESYGPTGAAVVVGEVASWSERQVELALPVRVGPTERVLFHFCTPGLSVFEELAGEEEGRHHV